MDPYRDGQLYKTNDNFGNFSFKVAHGVTGCT